MDLFEFARNEPTAHAPVYYTDEPDSGVQVTLFEYE